MSKCIVYKYKGVRLVSPSFDTNEELEVFIRDHTIDERTISASIENSFTVMNRLHREIVALNKRVIMLTPTYGNNMDVYDMWIAYVASLIKYGHLKEDNDNGVIVHTM